MVSSSGEIGRLLPSSPMSLWLKWRLSINRAAVCILILATALVFTFYTYRSLKNAENVTYQAQYDTVSNELLQGISVAVKRLHIASASMAVSASLAYPNATSWPNVYVTGYSRLNDNIFGLSNARVTLMPLVLPEEVLTFEDFAKEAFMRDEEVPTATAGYNDFGFGVFALDQNGARYHDITGVTSFSPNIFLTPVFMSAFPTRSKAFLYNTHSEEVRGTALDAVYACAQESRQTEDCYCMTATVQHISDKNFVPTTLLFSPVHASDHTLVGFSTLSFLWDELLLGLLSRVVDSVECVICTSTGCFTIELQHGLASLKGPGDLHNQRFDSTRVQRIVSLDTRVNSSATYSVSVYSTQDLHDKYTSSRPLIAALSCLAVIVLNMVVMLGYDRLVADDIYTKDAILKHKRDFVRFVSHEVRTPLNSVSLGLRFLEEELQDKVDFVGSGANSVSSTAREPDALLSSAIGGDFSTGWAGVASKGDLENYISLVREIQSSSRVAVSVLNDFLQYDKIEAGTLVLERKPVSLHKAVQDNLKLFHMEAAEKRVNLVLMFDTEDPEVLGASMSSVHMSEHPARPLSDVLPLHQADLRLLGDHVRLGQVVRNLISNAIKFSDPHSTITVRVQWKLNGLPAVQEEMSGSQGGAGAQPAGSLMLSVADEGPGMTPADLSRLFQEGVQFNPNELQGGQGSGLGLWISRGIVDLHKGRIWAESPGLKQGCTFFVELPAVRLASLAASTSASPPPLALLPPISIPTVSPTQSPQRPRSPASIAPSKLAVLVVDDAPSNRKCVVRLLERRNYVCTTAEDGAQAVEVMKSDLGPTFDCILMDHEMPKIRGPEAVRLIRELGFVNVKIFGLTGNVMPDDVECFMRAGADLVLEKPLVLSAFEEAMA